MQLFFIISLQADTLIAPFSESAALMLRELLIRLTMNDNEHEKLVSTHIADLPESTSTCNELQELKLESELQEQFGLGSRSTVSVSSDNLSASSDLDHSLRKGKVR
jgi:mevalonate kinase